MRLLSALRICLGYSQGGVNKTRADTGRGKKKPKKKQEKLNHFIRKELPLIRGIADERIVDGAVEGSICS